MKKTNKFLPLNTNGNCPHCNKSWDGGSILGSFKQFKNNGDSHYKDKSDNEIEQIVIECYGSLDARWSQIIGIEIQGDYDGISYWKCPFCETYFDRFTGKIVEKDNLK